VESDRQPRYHWLMTKMPKRPRDPKQLAMLMFEIATGETSDSVPSGSPMAE
jgi:hypothetical protein